MVNTVDKQHALIYSQVSWIKGKLSTAAEEQQYRYLTAFLMLISDAPLGSTTAQVCVNLLSMACTMVLDCDTCNSLSRSYMQAATACTKLIATNHQVSNLTFYQNCQPVLCLVGLTCRLVFFADCFMLLQEGLPSEAPVINPSRHSALMRLKQRLKEKHGPVTQPAQANVPAPHPSSAAPAPKGENK